MVEGPRVRMLCNILVNLCISRKSSPSIYVTVFQSIGIRVDGVDSSGGEGGGGGGEGGGELPPEQRH